MGYFCVADTSRRGREWLQGAEEAILATAEGLEEAEEGQLFARWDYMFRWNRDCVKPSKLEALKVRGDDIADEVCRVLDLKPHQDSFSVLQTYMDTTPQQKWHASIARLYEQLWHGQPPTSSKSKATHKEANQKDLIQHGQAVFKSASFEILSSLLHYSLTLGFSSSQLTSTLKETNYLTSTKRETAWRRLLETTQFVLDASSESLQPGHGSGWKSCLRVRLLHAQVRRRILAGRGRAKQFDPQTEGLPINQAFLLATLGSFCVAPIWSMRRVGTRLSRSDEEAFVALWQRIGFFMGVDADLLQRHFSSLHRAESYFVSAVCHLYSDLEPLDPDPRRNPCMQILLAVAHRPPSNTPVESLAEITRMYAGDPLADYLSIPKAASSKRLRMRLSIAGQNLLSLFGRMYPRRRWALERQELTIAAINSIIQWQLGYRRTRFAAKSEASNSTLADDSAEEYEPSTAAFGLDVARRMKRRWRALLLEAFVVVGGCLSGLVLTALLALRHVPSTGAFTSMLGR